MAMKILTQNHAFAQEECAFLAHTLVHFDCNLFKDAVYSQKNDMQTSLSACDIALSGRISTECTRT